MLHINIVHQVANMLTKGLTRDRFAKLCCLLGVVPLPKDLPTYMECI